MLKRFEQNVGRSPVPREYIRMRKACVVVAISSCFFLAACGKVPSDMQGIWECSAGAQKVVLEITSTQVTRRKSGQYSAATAEVEKVAEAIAGQAALKTIFFKSPSALKNMDVMMMSGELRSMDYGSCAKRG